MAHLVHDPRTGRWAQEYNAKTCRGCQGRLALPHFRPVFRPCHAHHDHWILVCKDCNTENWETECDVDSQHTPLEGHAH